MRTVALERLPVITYALGLAVAGRLLGPEANPLIAALVPASIIVLGLVLPVSPVWVRRSLLMLAGGTFILGATCGAFFAAGGASTVGAPRWLAVLVPGLYILYLEVGIDHPSTARDASTRAADFAERLVASGLLLWVAVAGIVAADALTGAPPTPNDAGWLIGAGGAFVGAGAVIDRYERYRRSPARRHMAALRSYY